MKKLYSVLVLLCWLAYPALSQGGRFKQRPGLADIESLKSAFIVQRLNMTPDESQKFWPIYNLYSAEVRQVYITYRTNNNEIQLDESLLTIRKKYSVEFLKALSPGKINDFFRAEKDFYAMLQKEKQRRQLLRRPFAPGQ